MSTEINIKKRITILEESAILTKDVNSIDFIGAGVTASTVGDNVTVNVQGSVGATAYYLNETVTQAPYKEFSSIPTLAAEQTIATVVGAGATATIQSFQTPSGTPNTTNIPAGLWQFYLHFSGTSGDSWDVYAEVYKRDLGGIETLLLTTDIILTTTLTAIPTMILTDGVFPASTVLTTDRIVVKVLAINLSGVSKTITFHTEGSTNYSVGTTTLNQIVPTGAVTSVTGTAPVVSSGGTTPAISIPQATGAVDGYLSSLDFAVFNAKVGGSGTLNYVSKFTGIGTLGNSNIFDNGTNVGIGITTPTASLHVTNVGTQNSFLVEDSANPDTTPFVITNTGRVGIGTTAPGYELDIRSSNPQLRVYADINNRAFSIYPGQGTIESDNTAFYINRISTNDIALGIGGGKVGIGTATPTVPLQVKGTAIPSAGEAIAKFEVSDSSAFLQIGNGTATNGAFAPVIQGRQVGTSTQPALQTEGIIDNVDDTGTTPVTIFKTRLNTLAQVVTRPVFQFSNWTSDIMTMLANGNVGIGTTGPTEKLEVNGKTKTTTFQMTTTPTAGYVLTSDASGNGTWQANGNGTVTSVGLTAGTGITLGGTNPITSSGSITVTNSAPDQVVALTAGTGINVTGTYPNFTINNTGALSDVNIYNADGTLSADRTVTMNNNQLTFNGGSSATGTQINLSAAANREKALNFTVGSALRWKQQVSGTEIGGDNGSQLAMLYYDDAGVAKGTAFSISRTNGAFRLNNAYSLPISAGTTGQVLTNTSLGLTAFQSLPAEIQVAASNETTNLTTGTAKVTFRMPYAMTLTAVRASLSTAQTAGALLTVDINLNGVSVLGTKLTFDNTEKTTVTAATPPTIVTSALTDDGEITVDIDTVGTAGARGLKITLIGTRA